MLCHYEIFFTVGNTVIDIYAATSFSILIIPTTHPPISVRSGKLFWGSFFSHLEQLLTSVKSELAAFITYYYWF